MSWTHWKFIIYSSRKHSLQHFSWRKLGYVHTCIIGMSGLFLLFQSFGSNPMISQSLGLGNQVIRKLFTLDPIIKNYFTTQNTEPQAAYIPGHYYVKYRSNEIVPTILFQDFDASKDSKEEYIASLSAKRAIAEKVLQTRGETNITTTSTIIAGSVGKMEEISKIAGLQKLRRVMRYTDGSNEGGNDALNNFYRLEIDPNKEIEVIESLQNDSNIEYIEKIPVMHFVNIPNDPQLSSMWYLTKVKSIEAWSAGAIGNSSVKIAVLDNAIDINHPDLSNAIVNPYDASNGDNDPSPIPNGCRDYNQYGQYYGPYYTCDHGTHTAGLVGAINNNSIGIASIGGGIKIVPVKISEDGGLMNSICEGIDWAISQNVNVISMSFGGGGISCVQQQAQLHPEIMFIAAAGNNNSQNNLYPCAYPGVYCVAATNENDKKASFSDYGSKVDIAAPGTNILSTMPNNSYASNNGTSMATPIVASLAGLLKSIAPNKSASEILGIISSTADNIGVSGIGAGRINVCKAVNAAGIPCNAGSTTNSNSSTTSNNTCFDGILNGTETDIDCGGSCNPCQNNLHCNSDNDCQSNYCNLSNGSNAGSTTNTAGSPNNGGGTTAVNTTSSPGSSSPGSSSPGSSSPGSSSPGSTSNGNTSSNPGGVQLKGSNGNVNFSSLHTKPYIIIDFSAAWCGPCRKKAAGFNSNTNFQAMINDPTKSCNFITIAEDLNSRKSSIGASSFVGIRSFEGTPNRNLNSVAISLGLSQFSGIPHVVIMDQQGNEYPESQINTLCNQTNPTTSAGNGNASTAGQTTTSSSTTSNTTTNGGTSNGTTTSIYNGDQGRSSKNLSLTQNGGSSNLQSHVTKNYLFITATNASCGGCVDKLKSINANTSFQNTINNGPCDFISLTEDGDITSLLTQIGSTSFVGQRTYEVPGNNVLSITNLLYPPYGQSNANSTYFILDKDGKTVGYHPDTPYMPAFTMICGQQYGTSSNSTTASNTTTTAGTTTAGTTTSAPGQLGTPIGECVKYLKSSPTAQYQRIASNGQSCTKTLDECPFGSCYANGSCDTYHCEYACYDTVGTKKDIADFFCHEDTNTNITQTEHNLCVTKYGANHRCGTYPQGGSATTSTNTSSNTSTTSVGQNYTKYICNPNGLLQLHTNQPGYQSDGPCTTTMTAYQNCADLNNNLGGNQCMTNTTTSNGTTNSIPATTSSIQTIGVFQTQSIENETVPYAIIGTLGLGVGICEDNPYGTTTTAGSYSSATNTASTSSNGSNTNGSANTSTAGSANTTTNTSSTSTNGNTTNGGTTTVPTIKYGCSLQGTCVADPNGPYTNSMCDNACNIRYSCQGSSCVIDKNGSYTNPTCNNMCSSSTGGTTATTNTASTTTNGTTSSNTSQCNYICLTPSTANISPQNALLSAAQTCSIPGPNSPQCAGIACAGVCEDGNNWCFDDNQCNGLKCKMRNLSQDKPCGGIPKYKCIAGACIRDDINGTFTHPTCNNMCAGGSGYSCLGSVPSNAKDCGDGPLPNNSTTHYFGANYCSAIRACDWICNAGYKLDGNQCVSINGATSSSTSSSTSSGASNGSTSQSTSTSSSCIPTELESLACGDKKDNDCDGYIDCNDSDCRNNIICLGITTGATSGSGTSGSYVGIGNGKLEGGEQCDDGNLNNNDGCSRLGIIEPGRKCTSDQPSRCGTIDCMTHGQSYNSNNIFGTCCSGLTGINVSLEINGSSGANQISYTLCYDSLIDDPLCLRQSGKPEGWYLKKQKDASPELVLAGTCTIAYRDYYAMLSAELKEQQDFCAYDDINYNKVNFKDINNHREKMSIQALQKFCIVKGRGNSLTSFSPESRTSRAEFIKMLVKTMYIGKMKFDESGNTEGSGSDIPYLDVSNKSWSYQYIAQAYTDGLLQTIDKKSFLSQFFYPNRSINSDEIIDILMEIKEGQQLTKESIKEILGNQKFPNRAKIATLLVRKFMPTFSNFFYMQGNNKQYYKTLMSQLRGKKYTEQYNIIMSQINTLEEKEKIHGSADNANEINYFWIKQFLKKLFTK